MRLVGEVLVEQAAFLNNCFVMGPAIPANSGHDDLRNLVRIWVDRYGFHFLEVLSDPTTPLSVALGRLRPTTSVEEQIVDSLRRALQ